MVAGKLQRLLSEANCLDLFQTGFRPCYGTEMVLVTLVDDMHWNYPIIILLVRSMTFNTIYYGILLDHLLGLELGGTVLQWFWSCIEDRVC